MEELLPHVSAFVLAGTHLYASKLRLLNVVPRSRWLSIAGGVSIAYVFVHVLPELHESQRTFLKTGAASVLGFVEAHAYLVALAGLCLFYGLELLAVRSRIQRHAETGTDQTGAFVFWIHLASFGLYNALIGYLLLHREVKGTASLIFYVLAIGLHFVCNDVGLREHHKDRYHRFGRWILATSILIGWALGAVWNVHRAALAVLFAFLAGGMIMNVIKEELPKERESRFWAFAAGVALYAALLILA